MKNKTLLLAFFLLCSKWLAAQTIINQYAAVTGFRYCDNVLRVDTATLFDAGDTVLIIQMKGAVIDSSNTAAFGNVVDYRGAGSYEYNVVETRNGNELRLQYTIQPGYDIPDGKVQLVRVPSYQNYTISQPHTCAPWDGSKGGVFAIWVTQTLSLEETIDVSGKGFRGGTNTQSPTQVGPLICSNANYYLAPNYDRGSMKGEGISMVSLERSFGRGKLVNGGGGGNSFNAGGGGGSNGGAGGLGGSEYRGCNSVPTNNITGGVGGTPLAYTGAAHKIFMGGGGGCGQINNLTVSTGGSGGGICLITAGNITGSSGSIKADGENALECTPGTAFGSCHDGMGGGGGGGAILLNTDSVSSLIPVSLKGGKGANQSGSGALFEVGPGGGGGGGILWTKPATTPANLTVQLSGGINGTVLYNGSVWGAQPGQAGQILTGLQLAFPTDSFSHKQIIADFSDSVFSCFSRRLIDNRAAFAANTASWLWLLPGQDTAVQQHPLYGFPGYGNYPVTLIVTGINGCKDTTTHNIAISYRHFAIAGRDTGICIGDTATLRAGGGIAYTWQPAARLDNAASAAPRAAPLSSTDYIVTVTDSIGCIDEDTARMQIYALPEIGITTESTPIVTCIHRETQLSGHGGIAYTWSPGFLCNDSTSANPIVSPPVTTLFTLTGTDMKGCSNTDTITVTSLPGETRIFMPNAFSPDNNGLNDDIKPLGICNFNLDHFTIYNRLGQKMFFTTTAGKGWDGTYNGKAADIGTYFYMISGKNERRETLTLRGSFILLR